MTPLRRFDCGSSEELCDRQLSVAVRKYLRQHIYKGEWFVRTHSFCLTRLALLLVSVAVHYYIMVGACVTEVSSLHGS